MALPEREAPWRSTVEERFTAATPGSHEMWRRAREVFPDGVSGQAKSMTPYPVFVSSASGATIVDVDGREYVDLLMGAGPMLLGHSHPAVVRAVHDQIDRMANPMAPTASSIEYAERLRGHMPYLERLRFTNTGSEATRSAIRVARAVTGRTKLGKFEGNFHGSDDAVLVSTHSRRLAGSRQRPLPVLDYAGMSSRLLEETVVFPYNNADMAATLIEENRADLAAVIMEPLAFSSGGAVPAERDFVEAVREVTARHAIPLIFDEVLCALRLGLGGAPAYTGVVPDLATIGKAIGGGLPLAAFGGRADFMEAALGREAGERRVFQSGTFTENPLSIAAGLATLTVLESEPALERANAAGQALREGLVAVFAKHGVTATITGMASIAQMHLGVTRVRDRRDVLAGDHELTREVMLGLVAEGVLWPPVHPAVTSAAHDQSHIDRVLDALDTVLRAR